MFQVVVHGIPWAYDDEKLQDIFRDSTLTIVNAEVIYGKDSKSRVRSLPASYLTTGNLQRGGKARKENDLQESGILGDRNVTSAPAL